MNPNKNDEAFRHWIEPPVEYSEDMHTIQVLIRQGRVVPRNITIENFFQLQHTLNVEITEVKHVIAEH